MELFILLLNNGMIILLIILSFLGFLFIGSLILLSCATSVAYDVNDIEWRLHAATLYGDSSSRRRARRLEKEMNSLSELPLWEAAKRIRSLRREADLLLDEVIRRA